MPAKNEQEFLRYILVHMDKTSAVGPHTHLARARRITLLAHSHSAYAFRPILPVTTGPSPLKIHVQRKVEHDLAAPRLRTLPLGSTKKDQLMQVQRCRHRLVQDFSTRTAGMRTLQHAIQICALPAAAQQLIYSSLLYAFNFNLQCHIMQALL